MHTTLVGKNPPGINPGQNESALISLNIGPNAIQIHADALCVRLLAMVSTWRCF